MEILLYVLMCIVGFIGVAKELNTTRSNSGFYYTFLILFLIIACIRLDSKMELGDINYYIDYFEDDVTSYFEPGYIYFTKAIKFIFGFNPYILIASASVWIFVFCNLASKICSNYIPKDLDYLLSNQKTSFYISLTYFVCVYWGCYFAWQTLRIGLATSIMLCSSAFFINNKIKHSVVLALFSILFHTSCVIFAAGIFILSVLKPLKCNAFLCWIIIIIITRIVTVDLSAVINVVGTLGDVETLERFAAYSDPERFNELGFFGAQNIFYHVSAFLMLKGDLKDPRFNKAVLLYYFGLTLGVLFQYSEITMRIQSLFLTMIVFVLYYFSIDKHFKLKTKLLIIFAYTIVEMGFAIRQFGWYI